MISERRTLSLVVGGLVAMLIVGLTAWFFDNFERRTKEVAVGYSAKARRNDLLAAEYFLRRLGIEVASVPGRDLLWGLPPPTDTLVVRGLGPMSAERRARLQAWLERGGHLVVEAMDAWSETAPHDDFLGDLGVRLQVDTQEPPNVLDEDWVLAQLEMPGSMRPLRVAFRSRYYLESVADWPHDDVLAGGRPRLMRFAVGAGRVTVLSDSRFMTNAQIGKWDNALFTVWLTQPETGGKVWLLYRSSVPWLGALLWSLAPHALISAAVLLIVWLWSIGGRLGPMIGVPDRGRRDVIEHMDASADFLWRHGRAGHLVETSRRRILAAWLRRHPDLAHSDAHAQAQRIAELTGQSFDAVSRALFTQAKEASGFVEQGQLLRALWQSSARGGQVQRHTRRTPRSGLTRH